MVDTATGIADVRTNEVAPVVYSLQGVRQNKVQKGLNIVNGKKVIAQ
jgi:hypothetical protein